MYTKFQTDRFIFMACSDDTHFLGSLDLWPWEKGQGQTKWYTLVEHLKKFCHLEKFLPYLQKCGFGSDLLLEKKKRKTTLIQPTRNIASRCFVWITSNAIFFFEKSYHETFKRCYLCHGMCCEIKDYFVNGICSMARKLMFGLVLFSHTF